MRNTAHSAYYIFVLIPDCQYRSVVDYQGVLLRKQQSTCFHLCSLIDFMAVLWTDCKLALPHEYSTGAARYEGSGKYLNLQENVNNSKTTDRHLAILESSI